MGCFDVTCSISGTQIAHGDKIYLFKLNDSYKRVVENYPLSIQYEIRNRIYEAKKPSMMLLEWFESEEFRSMDRKSISDDDYMKARMEWEKKFLADTERIIKSKDEQVEYFFRGVYDDYWWLEWVDRMPHEKWIEDWDFIIYMHEWAFHTVMEMDEEKILSMTKGELVFHLITQASYKYNLNLFWNNFLWEQSRSIDEMEWHLRLHKEAVKFLKEKIKERKEDF